MNALDHRSLLYRELASLTKAGFPLDKAASTLLQRASSPQRRPLLEALRDGLARGLNLSGSLRPQLSDMEHSLIEACERGGRFVEGFEYLADFFALRSQTRSRILRQLIYPLLLLHLCPLPLTLPLIFTQGFGAFVVAYVTPILALYAVLIAGVLIARALGRRAKHQAGLDRALNAIPVLGKWRRAEALARFCKVLEISLLAGQLPSQAVPLAAAASDSGAVVEAARRIAPEIVAGQPLGPQMAGDRAFPIELADGLATAELAGTLEKEAGRWAGYMQAEANQAADLVAQWFPRIIYGAAMVVAVIVIIKFVLSYLSMIGGMIS